MGILNNENLLMRNEIVNYSKEIKSLSEALEKTSTPKKNLLETANLSFRELEILN